MPRRLNNWKFEDIESFLRDHDFRLHHTNGSHYYYIGKAFHFVCVPFHGSKTIKPRTVKSIIIQSGIDQEIWFGNKR